MSDTHWFIPYKLLFLGVAAAVLVSGCSRPAPAPKDGRRAIEERIQIEFVEDCMWSAGGLMGWDGTFDAVSGGPKNALESFHPSYFRKQKASKG
jgi:hypothetical protein